MDDVAVGDQVEHAVTRREGRVLEVDSARREAKVLFRSGAGAEAWVKFDQLIDLRASRAPRVAACTSCYEPNEYQPPNAVFTCGKCRHEASLREDAPETQKSRRPVATYAGQKIEPMTRSVGYTYRPSVLSINGVMAPNGISISGGTAPSGGPPVATTGGPPPATKQSVTTNGGVFREGDYVAMIGSLQVFRIIRFYNYGSDVELEGPNGLQAVVDVTRLSKLSPNVCRGVPMSPGDVAYLHKFDSVRYIGANTALANAEGVIVTAAHAVVEVEWNTVKAGHKSFYFPQELELIP